MNPQYRRAKRTLSRLLNADKHKKFYINLVLRIARGDTYVEIGVRNGDCFRRISCPLKIAVDPNRTHAFRRLRPGEQFFQMESDRFFSDYAKGLFVKKEINVALVDGLHEYHQALRDVLNCERYMAENGIIFIHDCNPPSKRRTEVRDGGSWNGDVWKVAYYLRHYRRDLDFFTIDCDTGLGVLTGFSTQLGMKRADQLQDARMACKELDYSVLEQDRANVLNLKTIELAKQRFRDMFADGSARSSDESRSNG